MGTSEHVGYGHRGVPFETNPRRDDGERQRLALCRATVTTRPVADPADGEGADPRQDIAIVTPTGDGGSAGGLEVVCLMRGNKEAGATILMARPAGGAGTTFNGRPVVWTEVPGGVDTQNLGETVTEAATYLNATTPQIFAFSATDDGGSDLGMVPLTTADAYKTPQWNGSAWVMDWTRAHPGP